MRRFRFISYVATAFFAIGLSTSCNTVDRSAENHKAIVQRFWDEVWNKGNLAAADEICAANYTDHGPAIADVTTSLEGLKQVVTRYRNAFPDLQLTIDDVVAVGDKVVTRWTGRGTHKGELMGIAPTEKQAQVMGISIYRLAGGKIEESWTSWDRMDLMQQLGAAPQQQSPSGDPN